MNAFAGKEKYSMTSLRDRIIETIKIIFFHIKSPLFIKTSPIN